MTKLNYQNNIREAADKQFTNRWPGKRMSVTDMTISSMKTNKIQFSNVQIEDIACLLWIGI